MKRLFLLGIILFCSHIVLAQSYSAFRARTSAPVLISNFSTHGHGILLQLKSEYECGSEITLHQTHPQYQQLHRLLMSAYLLQYQVSFQYYECATHHTEAIQVCMGDCSG